MLSASGNSSVVRAGWEITFNFVWSRNRAIKCRISHTIVKSLLIYKWIESNVSYDHNCLTADHLDSVWGTESLSGDHCQHWMSARGLHMITGHVYWYYNVSDLSTTTNYKGYTPTPSSIFQRSGNSGFTHKTLLWLIYTIMHSTILTSMSCK